MANTTLNPSDKSAGGTLSGGNLIFTGTTTTNWVRSVDNQNIGKYYWEATFTTWGGGATSIGVAKTGVTLTSATTDANVVSVVKNGNIWANGATSGSSIGIRAAGDTIGIAFDAYAMLFWCRVAPSGNWNGSGTANPATGVGGIAIPFGAGVLTHAHVWCGQSADAVTINFGDSAFSGTVPSGFTSGYPIGTVVAPLIGPMITII